MGLSLAMKILKNHLLKGELKAGQEIAIKIDQTLTQDSTGTMAYLQLEAMDIEDVATEILLPTSITISFKQDLRMQMIMSLSSRQQISLV